MHACMDIGDGDGDGGMHEDEVLTTETRGKLRSIVF